MKKLILSILMLFTCFSIASCSSFTTGMDDQIIIKNIKQEIGKNEKGEDGFYLIIEYDSDYKKPDKFFVPNGKKGDVGDTGNAIKEIDTYYDEKTKETTFTITFTDPTMEPIVTKVDACVGLTGFDVVKETEAGTIVVFNYSDGTKGEEILLPTGYGLKEFPTPVVNEDGSQSIKFIFTDDRELEINVPAPSKGEKGENGRGIQEITSLTDDKYYIIQIRYTDGELSEPIPFERGNKWYSGTKDPNEENIGIIGDFYFDTYHKIIYEKIKTEDDNEVWSEVIELKDSKLQTCTVTFDLNDTNDAKAWLVSGQPTMKCKEGSYFGLEMPLPIPARKGYEFDGWYLTKVPTANNGKFTDTTAVYSDLKLYANWKPIA